MKKKFAYILLGMATVFVLSVLICGCKGSESKLISVDAKAATCTEKGNVAYWTSEDGKHLYTDAEGKNEVGEEDVFIPPLGHQLLHRPAKEATDQAGTKEYWECSVCHRLFADEKGEHEVTESQLMVPLKLTAVAAKEATCTEKGNIAYWITQDGKHLYTDAEGKTEVEEEDVFTPPLGHRTVYCPAKEGTENEDGRKECWECEVCHRLFTDKKGEHEVTEEELLIPSALKLVDFIVEVPEDREARVLQLTDMQIIVSEKQRYEDRLGSTLYPYWAEDQLEERCYKYLRELMEEVKPDLVILTGDLTYGEFDDDGGSMIQLIDFMESYGVPWAPIFGNHEPESHIGIDWQCERLEEAEHCLFKQRELTGNGNYTVGIKCGGRLTRVFFMLDSNGCSAASEESLANGHTQTAPGFAQDQTDWYMATAQEIKELSPKTKFSFAFHIQTAIFGKAFEKYGFTNQDTGNHPINIDTLPNKEEGDFGIICANLKTSWDPQHTVFHNLKQLGADSVFVGHEHCISASVMYDGIRFQYGQKSSEHDRKIYVRMDSGKTVSSYYEPVLGANGALINTPLVGGTVIPLDTDGSITNPYIHLCKGAGAEIDWSTWDEEHMPKVNGIDQDYLWGDSALEVAVEKFGEENAYQISAPAQGKFYIDPRALRGKTTLSFSVYLPGTSDHRLAGFGEFAVRIKPSNLCPPSEATGTSSGYINYNSQDGTPESRKLEFDGWQTFTVDITDISQDCTEFSFVVAQGNVLYLKDIVVS